MEILLRAKTGSLGTRSAALPEQPHFFNPELLHVAFPVLSRALLSKRATTHTPPHTPGLPARRPRDHPKPSLLRCPGLRPNHQAACQRCGLSGIGTPGRRRLFMGRVLRPNGYPALRAIGRSFRGPRPCSKSGYERPIAPLSRPDCTSGADPTLWPASIWTRFHRGKPACSDPPAEDCGSWLKRPITPQHREATLQDGIQQGNGLPGIRADQQRRLPGLPMNSSPAEAQATGWSRTTTLIPRQIAGTAQSASSPATGLRP